MKGKHNPFSFGGGLRNGGLSPEAMELLAPIFQFEYMGAAEFELGAVPKAIQSLGVSEKELGTISFEIKQTDVLFESWDERQFLPPVKGVKKAVHLIAKRSHMERAINYIGSLARRNPPRLKESSMFRTALLDPKDPKDEYLRKTQGWLDLNNCLFFFTDKTMFEKTRDLLIEAPKEEAKVK